MKLEIKGLTKKYGDKYAINDLNIEIKQGVYGILGENGAGKSTLINILTDNLKRTKGEILLDGNEILKLGANYRKIIGYMPQQQGFYEHFSVVSFLKYIGELKQCDKKMMPGEIDNLLKKVNLYERRYEKIGTFSGGMKQRVLLAQALLGNPKIVILDEPTAGLDPSERINIRNIIAETSNDKIVIVATHVVSDIESIADEIIIMKSGEIVTFGSPEKLITTMDGKAFDIKCEKTQIQTLQKRFVAGNVFRKRDGIYFRVVGNEKPEGFQVVKDNISLEDVYLFYNDKICDGC